MIHFFTQIDYKAEHTHTHKLKKVNYIFYLVEMVGIYCHVPIASVSNFICQIRES